MEYLVLWFVMTAGPSIPNSIAPQDVRAPQCGQVGLIVGVIVDKLLNPTTAFFPDPHDAAAYCSQDIRPRVAALPPGEFHLATTEIGDGSRQPYIGIDPHTSLTFIRDSAPLPDSLMPPGRIRIIPLQPINLLGDRLRCEPSSRPSLCSR